MTSSLNRFVFATTLTFAAASLSQAPLTLEEMQRLSIPQLAERGRLAEQKLAALQGTMQESQRKQQAATRDYQAFSQKLWDNQAQLRTRTELLNAVLSNRNRGDLDKRASELAKKYDGVTGPRNRDESDRRTAELLKKNDAETGPRIRIVNPFTDSSHKRFYREDGSWEVAQIKGEIDALDKLSEVWWTNYRRAQWSKDEAERAYREYAQKFGEYEATKSELAMVREASAKRLAEFGRPDDAPSRPEAPALSPPKTDEWNREYVLGSWKRVKGLDRRSLISSTITFYCDGTAISDDVWSLGWPGTPTPQKFRLSWEFKDSKLFVKQLDTTYPNSWTWTKEQIHDLHERVR